MTRLGTGENCLDCRQLTQVPQIATEEISRSSVVNGGLVIGLVTGHCLRRTLLADQCAVFVRDGRGISRAGLDGAVGGRHKTGIDRSGEPASAEAGEPSYSRKRHDGYMCVCGLWREQVEEQLREDNCKVRYAASAGCSDKS